jgi:cyclophilin family peptidyl-prolyl cis-trans isomerase
MYLKNKIVTYSVLFLLGITSCGKPIADFTYQTPNGKTAPAEIVFENKSKEANSFEWSFGDGTSSTEITPKHSYKSSGAYTITLRAKKGSKTKTSEQKINIEAPEECLVEIETNYGNMICVLYNATPLHRDNFLKIAEDGTLSGTLFHRVINGFMIQGGDPNSKNASADQALGSGDLGYTVPAEFVDSLVHLKGALCAARTNNPQKRSSASQFYIVQGRPAADTQLDQVEGQNGFRYTKEQRNAYKTMGGTPQLDRNYTVFGKVIKGMEVIDKIAAVQTKAGDRPVNDVKMKVIVIK